MTYLSELDLPPSPPMMYDDQIDNRDTSLDFVDNSFDFDVNVDENHFSLSTNVPTIFVVKFDLMYIVDSI